MYTFLTFSLSLALCICVCVLKWTKSKLENREQSIFIMTTKSQVNQELYRILEEEEKESTNAEGGKPEKLKKLVFMWSEYPSIKKLLWSKR